LIVSDPGQMMPQAPPGMFADVSKSQN